MSTDPTRPASVRTTVHLLRHGKVHNPEGILYGQLPGFYLSGSGLAMADAAAASLATADIRYLVASSLLRAQQTARPIAAGHQLDIVTDDRVIEAQNDFAGQPPIGRDGALRKPRNWLKLRDPFTPSWGEPYLDIAHRMLGAVYTAVAALTDTTAPNATAPDGDVPEAVLVSHQLPIVTARRYLLGQRLWHDPRKRQCSVASVSSLTFVDGVFRGLEYTEPAAHIPAVDDPAGPTPATGPAPAEVRP